MLRTETSQTLRQFYDALHAKYGPQSWWPGETRTEIVVGAILTQNTNWANVTKAIQRLREADCLNWRRLRDVDISALGEMIRPAGYFRLKSQRLKNFVNWLFDAHGGYFDSLADLPIERLREGLLSINGIGPETADSILLYALDRPTFVVDTYTARIARRHQLIGDDVDYASLKAVFEDNLEPSVTVFNEFHALIVAVGKAHCGVRARCEGCPLEQFEHTIELEERPGDG